MPFNIIRQDITKFHCDAIVNAANKSLLGGGGVDGAIHRAAGPELLAECATLGGCDTGCAKITKGYKLPCKYVIHTVGPRYKDGTRGEREQLVSCYRESLRLAEEHGCESVAFPLISAGAYRYPPAEAVRVAVDTVKEYLWNSDSDMTVTLCVFDKRGFMIGRTIFGDINDYLGEHYEPRTRGKRILDIEEAQTACKAEASMVDSALRAPSLPEDLFDAMDESFSDMVFRIIRERRLDEVACYKKANIDRKLFSKIRSNSDYRPKKNTAMALAVGLELSLPEAEELLMKAGYAFSTNSKFDMIVHYFIENGIYDIFEINEALFGCDQATLGGS